MPLTLDQFVNASAGHNTAEFYIEQPSGSREARLQLRGRAGRLITSESQLRRDRAATAAVFRDAILDKIGSQITFLQNASDPLRTAYKRNLKSVAADLEASLDAQLRGDAALTADDVLVLASRLNKKLHEAEHKAIEAHTKAVNRNLSATLPEVQVRQRAAWDSLCPNIPLPANYDDMKQALKAFFATRPGIPPEKISFIDERIDAASFAASTTSEVIEKAISLAEELEGLHKDLLGYGVDIAVDRSTLLLTPSVVQGEGTFGRVSSLTLNGEEKVLKEYKGGSVYPVELDHNPALAPHEVKLSRALEVTASYLKDDEKTFIVPPSHFLVNEFIPGHSIKRLVVEVRDKEFRAWAQDQLLKNQHIPGYSLLVVGQIQDKAEGFELSEAAEHGRLKSSMIQPIAYSYMNALIAMAKRGFVHGDIKPANTFFDPSTRRLKLIDTGGMTKISKRPEREDETLFDDQRGLTAVFTLPNILAGEKAGFEQDLYSVGTSILILSLQQRGESDVARDLMEELHDNVMEVANSVKTASRALDAIEGCLNITIMPNASRQELAAIAVMKKAIEFARTGYLTDRENYIPILEELKDGFSGRA